MAREKLEKSKVQLSLELLDEYSEFILIDKHNLDSAIVDQMRVYNYVGMEYANAVSYRDQAKFELDKVKAECDKFIRQDAALANERITEAQVAAKILEELTYQKANDEFLEWKMVTDKWTALKESFTQRSYMLRELCQLWMAHYWADDVIASDRREAVDRIAPAARAAEARARLHKRVSEES